MTTKSADGDLPAVSKELEVDWRKLKNKRNRLLNILAKEQSF
ncbi:MAG: hypothetical protein ACOX04_01455 [Candidatus Scatomorpha sp.]